MSFCSLNSVEGSGILRTLSESSIPPVSVVDVSSVSSGSVFLMDESDVNYFLEDYIYDDDTVFSEVSDYTYDDDTVHSELSEHSFIDLLELYDQQEAIIRPPLVQKKERRAR